MATKGAEHQAKIVDIEFNSALDAALTASKARNSKVVKALLDLDKLKTSKNHTEDIKAVLEALKAENDYLFIFSENKGEPFHPIGANDIAGDKKMTLTEVIKYANTHPDVDVKTLI